MSLARPGKALREPKGQIVHFVLTGPTSPRLNAVVRVASSFRSAALAACQVVMGNRDSFLLSGHHPNGKPDELHEHAFYLPVPDDTGRISSVFVLSPCQRFSAEEMSALGLIRFLQWNGPSTRVKVELINEDDSALNQVATMWSSVTPYVPPRRFYGTHGKRHLVPERQLVAELAKLVPGTCEVEEARQIRDWQIEVRVPKRGGADRPMKRQGFYVRFRCAEPLCGPIVLGHSTHFGLGLFRPV